MIDLDTALVILCAGRGSRLGSTTCTMNKCAIPNKNEITPLEYIITTYHNCGIRKFVVVGGYQYNTVLNVVTKMKAKYPLDDIVIVKNNKYDYHGCEYSLATAANYLTSLGDYNFSNIIITEGDTILPEKSIKKIVESNTDSVLVRNKFFIKKNRSVVLTNNKSKYYRPLSRFVYDPDHNNVYNIITKDEKVVGESVQVWKFLGNKVSMLLELLTNYFELANKSNSPYSDSGVYNINLIISDSGIKPIFVGHKWININTIKDLKKFDKVRLSDDN